MTSVIKSNLMVDRGDVRPILARQGIEARTGHQPAVAPEIEQLRIALDLMKLELEKGRQTIEELEKEARQAFAAGEAKGIETGKAEADQRRTEAFRILEAGVAKAGDVFSDGMKSAERLGASLAVSSLEKLFGAEQDRAEQVSRIIRHQVLQISEQAVLRIEVSAEDFPDAGEIASRKQSGSLPHCEIVPSKQLKAGDCVIKLVLGTMEVGLDQQWGKLRAALDSLAERGAAE